MERGGKIKNGKKLYGLVVNSKGNTILEKGNKDGKAFPQDSHNPKQTKSQHRIGEGKSGALTLAEEVLAIKSCQERKRQFS